MSRRTIKKLSLRNSIFFVIISFVLCFMILTIGINFYISNRSTKTFATMETKEISNQIVLNYENYFNSVFSTFFYLEVETINAKDLNELNHIIQIAFESRENISGITFLNKDNETILSTGVSMPINQEYLDIIKQYPTIYNLSTPYMARGTHFLQLGKLVTYNISNEDVEVTMIIEIDFQNIIDISRSANLGDGGFISIINNNYSPVFTTYQNDSADTNFTKLIQAVEDIIVGSKEIKLGSHAFVVNVQTLSNTRWKLAIIINVDNFYQAQSIYNTYTIGVGIIGLLLSIIVSSIIAKRVANPLKKLEEAMKEVEEGNFKVSIDTDEKHGQIEVVNLTLNFNHMVIRIRELMETIMSEQKAKRHSELKALQNQINPHFLYNTLDSIVFLAESNQNDEVKKMVIALAKFFRIGISKGRTIIKVKDELEHAKNYMIIQSIRYKDSFSFEIAPEVDVLEMDSMKLILQPFIENSIYHGLKNSVDVGFIKITAYHDNEFLYYVITDNGLGMKQDKIISVYENMKNQNIQNSVGIKNVYQRIKLYYGEKADIIIESELDEYTRITIKFPLERMEK